MFCFVFCFVLFYQGFQLPFQAAARNRPGVELSRLNDRTSIGGQRGKPAGQPPWHEGPQRGEDKIRDPGLETPAGPPRWEARRRRGRGAARGGGRGRRRGGATGRRAGADSQIQELTDSLLARHRGRPRKPLPRSRGRRNPARDRLSTPAPRETRRPL